MSAKQRLTTSLASWFPSKTCVTKISAPPSTSATLRTSHREHSALAAACRRRLSAMVLTTWKMARRISIAGSCQATLRKVRRQLAGVSMPQCCRRNFGRHYQGSAYSWGYMDVGRRMGGLEQLWHRAVLSLCLRQALHRVHL